VTTAIDSNVIIALWNKDDVLNVEARCALEEASQTGSLVICGPVYVEVRTLPGRDEAKVDAFLNRTGISIDWRLDQEIWREAARASHEYGRRRSADKQPSLPRRTVGDFVIGAHAMIRGHSLLTMDRCTFRVAFPRLTFASRSS
jgi:predicted nucleic acid-binding protein